MFDACSGVDLMSGLAGESSRWEVSISELELKIGSLPGDVAIAIAFMSYCGPFPADHRSELVQTVNSHTCNQMLNLSSVLDPSDSETEDSSNCWIRFCCLYG